VHEQSHGVVPELSIPVLEIENRRAPPDYIVLWGARGQPPARSKEFLDVWKKFAKNLEYGE
jgi:hypothetical protein